MTNTGRLLHGLQLPKWTTSVSLGDFFFECGEKYATDICQIDATIDKSETYQSVKQRSVRVAIAMQNRGITSKDVIVTCSSNTLDNTIPIIASFYLGIKVANYDPTLSVRNTKHLLQIVPPTIVFVEESAISLVEESLKNTDLNTEIIVFGSSNKYTMFDDLVKPQLGEEKFKPVKTDIHETAVLFFSSGTTGLPKAICHSHQNILRIMESFGSLVLDGTTNILHFTTMYWISGIFFLVMTFMCGGTRIFCRDSDGENTLRLIEKYQVNFFFVAPVYTYSITSVKNPAKYDTSPLRCFLTGGTPIGPEQIKRLNDLFTNASILFAYGMTEVGMIASFDPKTDQEFLKAKTGSCGKLVHGIAMKVVDPNTDQLLGTNQKGEIRVKSFGLMKGYYQQDSSNCFDGDGFFKTGDIGYYDEDECIYVIDRIKEMFKYQSWHIVPSSIEAVLLEHPAVKEAVVFGIPRGEEGDVPAACVVLEEDCDVDKEEIKKFVEERVSDRERLRGGVTVLNDLPKTPSGKIIRQEAKRIIVESM